MGVSRHQSVPSAIISCSRRFCRVVSFLAAFALENYRVPDVPTIVVATASWAISAALLALCLHTIWEGGGISIREKLGEARQAVVACLQQLWIFQIRMRGHEDSGPDDGAEVDSAPDEGNVAKPASMELQSLEVE